MLAYVPGRRNKKCVEIALPSRSGEDFPWAVSGMRGARGGAGPASMMSDKKCLGREKIFFETSVGRLPFDGLRDRERDGSDGNGTYLSVFC